MPDIYISVVTPVYGCREMLEILYERLKRTLSGITDKFEIIMVNDASPDNAWDTIKKLSQRDARVKGIDLSRNFGQHHAITAGLDYAKGEWVVVMDCDLQDQPEEITKLYNKAIEGNSVVFGRRYHRKDKFFKKLTSKLFYKVYNYFTEGQQVDNTVANFGIFSSSVIKNFKNMREQSRSIKLFVRWMGFDAAYIDIEHAKRQTGISSYSMGKLIELAFDRIIAHSNKPLRLFIKLGFLFSVLSFFYGTYILARYFLYGISVEGWTTVVVSMYFIGGLLFANLGILGIYIGKIFNETKKRPLYIVKELTWYETDQ
jgi:dolichol-phosphate mannosyltransferase